MDLFLARIKRTREQKDKLCATQPIPFYSTAASNLPEVVKGRGVLRVVEVHQAQVIGDDPLEWVQVDSTLQARHRGGVQALK